MLWRGGYAALSSFGFGGSNVHLLLQGQAPKQATTAVRVISVTAEDAGLAQPVQEALEASAAVPEDEVIPLAARTPLGIEALREAIKVSICLAKSHSGQWSDKGVKKYLKLSSGFDD